MVQLPLSAIRRRASPSSSVVWGDCSSCNKMQAVLNNTIVAEEIGLDHESDFPRQQIVSLNEAFEIDKVLGSGGFGIVHKATLRSGGPASAVKTIAKTSHYTEAIVNTEIRTLQGLTHECICKLLNVCEDPEHFHLVLEYVPGHELFEEILPHRPMKESRAACIMRQVFQALQYCHELRPAVIHRDLKPENIMVTDGEDADKPQVKLIDFGLAAVCHDTIQTPLVGTVCYMSPEALSSGIYSRASDMWSAGAVLHMLLTGGDVPPQFKPLGSSNTSQARPLHGLDTSKAAQDILNSLLKRRPEQRLTAASAVMHQWTTANHSLLVPICKAEQEENVDPHCCQLDNIRHRSLSATVPLHSQGQLVVAGDCIDHIKLGPHAASGPAPVDQLSWTHVDFTNSSSSDFAVFNDLEQADRSPDIEAKQDIGIRNEIQGEVLQGTTTTTTAPRRSRCQLISSCTPCKENLGPGARRVCKQLPMPPSSRKRTGASLDCAKNDPLRTRPMR